MKELKLREIHKTATTTYFIVEKQSHKGKHFGTDDEDFEASNGIRLASNDFPEHDAGLKEFYVRGYCEEQDNDPVKVSNEDVGGILQAVQEYNDTFGEWKPKNGETYYFFDTAMELCKADYKNSNGYDLRRQNIGNCFRTEEECQSVIDKIKMVLKEE